MKNVYIAVDDFTGVLDFMSVFGPVDIPPPPYHNPHPMSNQTPK